MKSKVSPSVSEQKECKTCHCHTCPIYLMEGDCECEDDIYCPHCSLQPLQVEGEDIGQLFDESGNNVTQGIKGLIAKEKQRTANSIFKDLEDAITIIHGGKRYDFYLAMKKKHLKNK